MTLIKQVSVNIITTNLCVALSLLCMQILFIYLVLVFKLSHVKVKLPAPNTHTRFKVIHQPNTKLTWFWAKEQNAEYIIIIYSCLAEYFSIFYGLDVTTLVALMQTYIYILFCFFTSFIVPMGIFPWEIQISFSPREKESQFRQSRATSMTWFTLTSS